jgi:tetratricopeptide (TPR) repeat protein
MKHVPLTITCLFLGHLGFCQNDSLAANFAEAMEHYRIGEAIAIAEQRLSADSSNPSHTLDLVGAYTLAGLREEAIASLEAGLARDSSHTLLWFKLARLRENEDNPVAAVMAYQALFETDSTNVYFYGRAAAFARKIGFGGQARFWYERCIALEPENIDPYLNLAEAEMEMRAFYLADNRIAQALSLDSLYPKALFLAGKSANLQQDHPDADHYFAKLFASGGGTALAARYYGISLYHLQRYPEAIEMMQILIDEAPDLDFPHYYRGLCYRGMGDLAQAEIEFEKAIGKIKKDNLALYHEQLGLLYQMQEKHGEAIKQLQMARNLKSGSDQLYHLALSYEVWYADKTVALRTYEAYLEVADSSADERWNYARSRRDALVKEAHFEAEK